MLNMVYDVGLVGYDIIYFVGTLVFNVSAVIRPELTTSNAVICLFVCLSLRIYFFIDFFFSRRKHLLNYT